MTQTEKTNLSAYCPCGSQQAYSTCCEPIHQQPTQVHQPEQLMRARYSAHVLGLVDFVINTYHPSCNAEAQRDAIRDSVDSDWQKLVVLSHEAGSHSDEGYVTFSAYFVDGGDEYCMTERSRFIRENGQWYYIDGEFPAEPEPQTASSTPLQQQAVSTIKIGRNDPCLCGSGKKFKKCCG